MNGFEEPLLMARMAGLINAISKRIDVPESVKEICTLTFQEYLTLYKNEKEKK